MCQKVWEPIITAMCAWKQWWIKHLLSIIEHSIKWVAANLKELARNNKVVNAVLVGIDNEKLQQNKNGKEEKAGEKRGQRKWRVYSGVQGQQLHGHDEGDVEQ